MTRATFRLIKVMRFLLLLVCLGGVWATLYYCYTIAFEPQQPGNVVALSVQTLPKGPVAYMKSLSAASQQAVKGGPAMVVPSINSGTLLYREDQPLQRVVLRILSTWPQPLPYVLFTLAFCTILWFVLRDIRPGVPFTPTNVRRIRWLGILLISSDVYNWLTLWWLHRHIATVAPAGPALTSVSSFGSSLIANWLVGILLIIIAAGYQRGVELAEDAELTV